MHDEGQVAAPQGANFAGSELMDAERLQRMLNDQKYEDMQPSGLVTESLNPSGAKRSALAEDHVEDRPYGMMSPPLGNMDKDARISVLQNENEELSRVISQMAEEMKSVQHHQQYQHAYATH